MATFQYAAMLKQTAVRTGTVIDDVRRAARPLGYTVAVHGSLREESDIDLIALPWNYPAAPRGRVSKAVAALGYLALRQVFRTPGKTHYIWDIKRPAAGCPAVLDLVIVDRAADG